MVLNDWMKLGVTEDEEDTFVHGIVSFAPEIEEKSSNMKELFLCRKVKDYPTNCRIVNHPILCKSFEVLNEYK